MDPSTVCNLRCPLCVQETAPDGRRRNFVEVQEYSRLVHDLAPHAIRLDLFNWGEPLLHPDFAGLVRTAGDWSLFTRTSTNLSLRTFDADAVVASGLAYLVVSIDGVTQQTYQRYRVRGSLDLVLDNLARLLAARSRLGSVTPVVEWQFLVLAHNAGEVEMAGRLAADLGVDVFRAGGARASMSDKLALPTPVAFDRSRHLLLDPAHELSEYDTTGHKTRAAETAGCAWLWGKAALTPDGGVAPCLSSWYARHDLADWRGGRFSDVWNAPAYQAARRSAASGGDPDGSSVCDRCAHHRNFVPVPDRDDEPLDPPRLAELAGRLASLGLDIHDDTVSAVLAELTRTGAHTGHHPR